MEPGLGGTRVDSPTAMIYGSEFLDFWQGWMRSKGNGQKRQAQSKILHAVGQARPAAVPHAAFRVDGRARSYQIEGVTQADSAAIEPSAVRLLSREEAEREDRLFWHSKTPAERLAAAEQLRQVAYGYDAATARIQAVVVRTFLKEG